MMARMEMDYTLDWWETVQDELFSKIQVWLGTLLNFAKILLQCKIPSGNCLLSFS